MNDNITYEVVKKEIQKRIINYLYQSKEIRVSEYDALMSKCNSKINDLKGQLEKSENKYNIKVDIKI